MTSLAEIEETVIRPLTRAEKEQLIKDVQKMLEEEELSRMFPPDKVFEISSIPLSPDDPVGQASQHTKHIQMR